MTFTVSRLCAMIAAIVFVVVAVLAFLTDTANLVHLVGGIAAGLAVLAAGSLLAA